MNQPLYTIELLEKTQLTHDVVVLRFERPAHFVFQAGQFVQFLIPEGGRGVKRSYSIASSPDTAYLEFLVKLIPGGKGSQYFGAMQVGDEAQISVPRGVFTLKLDDTSKKIFVATGVGIAPIMSMIESAPGSALMHLLFGVRTQADLFWSSRLGDVQKQKTGLTYDICLSRESVLPFFHGRVSAKLLEVLDLQAKYYVCGNLEMVKDIRTLLLESGVSMKQLHFEIF